MKQEEYWRDVPIEPLTPEWVRSLVQKCLQDQAVNPRTNYFLAAVCKQTGTVIGEAILGIESVWLGRGEARDACKRTNQRIIHPSCIGWERLRARTKRKAGTRANRL